MNDKNTESHVSRKTAFEMKTFGHSIPLTRTSNNFEQLFRILPGALLTRQRAEEYWKLGHQLFVFQDVIGDPPGIHCRVIKEFQPVLRTLLEAKLLCPDAKRVLITRWRKDFAFDLAPVTWVVLVFQAEFTEPQPLTLPELFY